MAMLVLLLVISPWGRGNNSNPILWGQGIQCRDSSDSCTIENLSFCLQTPREMFLVGSLVVLCGLLAHSTAQLAGLPLPLGQGPPLPLNQGPPLPLNQGQLLPLAQGLPLAVSPALPSNPTDLLAGKFTDGESMTVPFRGCSSVCVCVCVCVCEHVCLSISNLAIPGRQV
jgi:hypothetical protein